MTRHLIALLLCLGGAVPAAAFNDPGHMQSARLLVEALGEPALPAQRKLVAACAQLPDLSQELDAAKTYAEAWSYSSWDWFAWGTLDHLNNAALQRMFAVQQLLHGLTGGDPMALRSAALGTLRALQQDARLAPDGTGRLEAWCAFGLGLHLWGDAFAHTQVLWDGDDQATFNNQRPKMYPTGRGHGLSEGHFPDDLLCSYYTKPLDGFGAKCHQDWGDTPHTRQRQWLGYAAGQLSLGGYLDAPAPQDGRFAALLPELRLAGRKRAGGQDMDDAPLDVTPDLIDDAVGRRLRDFASQELQLPPEARFDADPQGQRLLQEVDANAKLGLTAPAEPCSAILDIVRGLPGIAGLPGAPAMRCERIWQRYAAVAVRQFTGCVQRAAGAPAACAQASPLDGDWNQVYGPSSQDAGYGKPIDCYAALVAARLVNPASAKAKACKFTVPH